MKRVKTSLSQTVVSADAGTGSTIRNGTCIHGLSVVLQFDLLLRGNLLDTHHEVLMCDLQTIIT